MADQISTTSPYTGSDDKDIYLSINKTERYLNDYLLLSDAGIADYEGKSRRNIDYGISMLKGGSAEEFNYRFNSDVQVLDDEWAVSKFLTPWGKMDEEHRSDSYYTWALSKTEDSSIGNHSVINPLPQFTRYADPRITTDVTKQHHAYGTKMLETGLGMGRYYSEAIDDYQQQVFMQFGVPEFNSMFSFLMNAANYEDTYVANHGRYPIEYGLSKALGRKIVHAYYPFISLAVFFIQGIYRTVMGFSPFQYYFLKPTMTQYWGTVNTIVSSMCVELGIYTMDPVGAVVDGSHEAGGRKTKQLGVPVQFNEKEMTEIKALLPNLFGDNTCYIDMYRLASTHQIISSRVRKAQQALMEKIGTDAQDVMLGLAIGQNKVYSQSDVASQAQAQSNGGLVGWVKNIRSRIENNELTFEKSEWFNNAGSALTNGFNTFKDLLGWFNGDDKSTTFWNFYDKARQLIWNEEKAEKPQPKGYWSYQTTQDISDAIKTEKNLSAMANTAKSSTDDTATQSKDVASANRSKSAADYLNSSGSDASNYINGNDENVNTQNVYATPKTAISNWHQSAAQVIDAVHRDGGLFVGFRVNTTRSASESFSNSTAPIETGELLKQVGGSARRASFSLSNGNLLPGMGDVIAIAKNIALGTLDGATFGLSNVIASALSGAFIDIPDRWDSSSCSMSNVTYSVRLVSPYGNPISQLQNIYIPLACLLAGVLPLQTGRASHTSPYICNLFCKGVQNIELGIITELSIERGVSNLPYSKWKQPLAIDVSFTVTDLSGIITAPVNRNLFQALLQDGFSGVLGQLTTESSLDDYIGTLCGRDLSNARFEMPKFQRKLKKAMLRSAQSINPNRLAMLFAEKTNTLAAILGVPAGASEAKRQNRNEVGKAFTTAGY